MCEAKDTVSSLKTPQPVHHLSGKLGTREFFDSAAIASSQSVHHIETAKTESW